MKRTASLLVLAAMASLGLGCELLNPKKDAGGGGGGGGGVDPTTMVKAPGKIYTPIVDGKVGYMVVFENEAAGNKSSQQYAIVNETDDAWWIEYSGPEITALAASFPDLKGQLMGLVVNKSDLKVTKAYLGKPGEKPKEIKINPAPDMPAAPKPPEGKAEKVKIGLGEFASMKYEGEGYKSWSGTEGDTKGVLLKSETAAGAYELKELPSKEDVDVGGTKVAVVKVKWTNDSETWYTADPVVKCFTTVPGVEWGMLATVTKASKRSITAMKTDAKPELKWE